AFSHSTDHRPAENGDASEEYERAYDDPDEQAGVPERPRLRHPVPHRRTREQRGSARRAVSRTLRATLRAFTRATSSSCSSVECSLGSLSSRLWDARRARAIHQPPSSSVLPHTPGRGRQGRTPLMTTRIANGTAPRRRNRHRVKGVSMMTTNRVRV